MESDQGVQRYGCGCRRPRRPAAAAAIRAEHPAPRKLPKGVDVMRRGPKKELRPGVTVIPFFGLRVVEFV